MFKKLIAVVLTFSLLLTGSLAAVAYVDELWGVPFLAYGGSLSAAELQEIHEIFGLDDGRDFDSVYVDGSDLVYFLQRGNPNSNMFSSVLITHRDVGTGIEVSILTPDYITRVTATQYATAMITAGVTDALVEVAAPRAVTGEAALAGIYKAFAERGVELDVDRMAVAQEQLEILSSISNYHQGNDDFDSDALDHAVIEIQSELASHYQETGELATVEEIQTIIAQVLEDNDLGDILTTDQIQRLRGFASNFQLTDAISSQDFLNQLSNLGERLGIGDRLSNLNLNINIDRGTIATWWDNIVSWFRNLFN